MGTIAQNLTELSAHLEDAYTALSNKGVDLTGKTHNATNLSGCIDSIQAGAGEVFNVPVDDIFGTVNLNGVYLPSTNNIEYVIPAKSTPSQYALAGKFRGSKSAPKKRNIKVTFPEMTTASLSYDCYEMCYYNPEVSEISFPKLQRTTGYMGFAYAGKECLNLKSVSFPQLTALGLHAFFMGFWGSNSLSSADFHNVQTVAMHSMQLIFEGCTSLKSLDLSGIKYANTTYSINSVTKGCTSLTSLNLNSLLVVSTYDCAALCHGCTKLSSMEFPSLTAITGNNYLFSNSFNGCTSLLSVSYPQLKSQTGTYSFYYSYYGCTALTSVQFPQLTSMTGLYTFTYAFWNCNNLAYITFPKLLSCYAGTSTSNATFGNANKLKDIYFPSLSAISNNYFFNASCTSLSGIHFNIDYKTQIEATTGYSTLWGRGAGSATVYFDRFDANGNIIDEDGNIIKELK